MGKEIYSGLDSSYFTVSKYTYTVDNRKTTPIYPDLSLDTSPMERMVSTSPTRPEGTPVTGWEGEWSPGRPDQGVG